MNSRKLSYLAVLCLACSMPLMGRDFYVSPKGSDSNPGTEERPWKTLKKASAEAQAGSKVLISKGIYHETLKPQHSGREGAPILFQAKEGEDVLISGAERVEDWTLHRGKIYKAKFKSDLGKNNQLFFNEKPLQEARWPNDKDGNPMTPDGAKIEGGSTQSIISTKLPRLNGLEGAVVWALADRGWSTWTSTITSYQPEKNRVDFQSYEKSWWVRERHNPKKKKGEFYLVGALSLLDAPGEWYYDEEEELYYLWAPGGADPNEHAVSVKQRMLGIDLSESSWIQITGIDLVGTTVDLTAATHCTLKGMKLHHISHSRGGRTQNKLGEKSGVHVTGHNNTIRDCEIAYSAGNGVTLLGRDNALINNWIHQVDYIGAYCAPVTLGGLRHLISHNTINDTGRDCIKLGGAEHLIQYNDISRPSRICHDTGVVYSGGQDGGNTRIRYNWVYDNPGNPGFYVGIYLDNYMKNYIVNHNVIWNVGNSIRLNKPTSFCMILNNSVDAQINNVWGPWVGPKIQWGSHVINNVTRSGVKMNPEVVVLKNVKGKKLDESFNIKLRKATGHDQGRGVSVAGITQDTPVVGAFHPKSSWKAGHDFKRPPNPIYEPANEPLRNMVSNPAFEYIRYYKEAGLESEDGLVGWEKTHGKLATLENHLGFNFPAAEQRNSIHAYSLLLTGEGDDGVEQTLSGLEPHTPYVFSAYVRHVDKTNVVLSVENGNHVPKAQSKDLTLGKKQKWRLVTVRFKTGSHTEVKVSMVKTGAGSAYIDDTGVVTTIFMDQAFRKANNGEE